MYPASSKAWMSPRKGVDEPSAVIRLDLQGFKDLHKAVGRVLALLEE